MLSLRLWGRLADRFSNKSVMAVSVPLFLLCLLGWTFTTIPEPHRYTLPLLYALHVLMGIATAGVTLASGNIALKLAPEGRATSFLAVNAVISSVAAGIAPILGGLLADFFAARELSLTVTWKTPAEQVTFSTLSFEHWDFFFVLAAVLGALSLQQLAKVKESGEITNREMVKEFLAEARRAVYNPSTIGGMRFLVSFPSAALLRMRTRGHPKP